MKLLTALDMTGNQVLNMRIQNLAGFSSGLSASHKGRIEFDTTGGQDLAAVWSGSAWVKIRDNWVASVAPASGSPVSVAGAATIALDITLASGSFLVGNGSNLARAVAKTSIPLSGFAAAAAAVDLGNNRITNLADPTTGQDAATKAYVDSSTQGLFVKTASRVATTVALPTHTFSGNVMTASVNGAFPAVDGVTISVGDRFLVKDEGGGLSLQNGIYTLTTAGSGGTPWTATRATDADTSAEVETGLYTLITEGTTWANTGWILTTVNPITLGTTALQFSLFSSAGQTNAGNGIVKVGSVIHFATASAYTTNGVAIATGTATMGFTANNATATSKYLRQVSSGSPTWVQIDISELTGGPVSGSGTATCMAKWTSGTAIGNSIVFDDGTHIGINTSTPSFHLDIVRSVDNTVYCRIVNQSAGNSARTGYMIEGEASHGNFFLEKFSTTYTLATSLQNCVMAYTNGDSPFCLGTAGTERMRLHVSGNTSIGSSLDRSKLFLANGELIIDHANGGTTNGAAMRVGTFSGGSFIASNSYLNTGTGTIRRTRAGGSNVWTMDTSTSGTAGTWTLHVAGTAAADTDVSYILALNVDGAGKVGVGVVPTAKFEVNGVARSTRVATAQQYVEADGGDAVAIYLRAVSASGSLKPFVISNLINPADSVIAANAIVFQTGRSDAPSEKARLDGLGNFGIATVSPASKLHIADASPAIAGFQTVTITSADSVAADVGGTIGFGGKYTGSTLTTWAGIAGFKADGTDGTFAGYLSFRTRAAGNLAERVRITSLGAVGINTAAPASGLHLLGTGQTTAALADSGNFGGSIIVQDSAASVGNGGAIIFAATNATMKAFAAIKGLITDGSAQGSGHLAFSTRANAADVALTERLRIDGGSGNITAFALAGIGTRVPLVSSSGVISTLGNGSNTQVLTISGGTPTWANLPTFGTVVSVGLTMPGQFSVTGSPVTGSGTLAATWNNQTANSFLAGPSSGVAATPTFRPMAAADIPSHDASLISGGNLPAGVTLGSKAITRSFSQAITIGTTSVTITHGLNTLDIHLMLRDSSGLFQMTDYTAINTTQVTVSFASATVEALTAVVHG